MNADLLKGKIRARGLTQRDVSGEIGLSLSRFNAKINNTGGAEFSLVEVRNLKKLLGLTSAQIDAIFFT